MSSHRSHSPLCHGLPSRAALPAHLPSCVPAPHWNSFVVVTSPSPPPLLRRRAEPTRRLTALLPQLAPLSLSAAPRQTQSPSVTHKHSRSLTFPSPPSVGPQEQKPSRPGHFRLRTKFAQPTRPFSNSFRH